MKNIWNIILDQKYLVVHYILHTNDNNLTNNLHLHVNDINGNNLNKNFTREKYYRFFLFSSLFFSILFFCLPLSASVLHQPFCVQSTFYRRQTQLPHSLMVAASSFSFSLLVGGIYDASVIPPVN